jgi:hypothetical protein
MPHSADNRLVIWLLNASSTDTGHELTMFGLPACPMDEARVVVTRPLSERDIVACVEQAAGCTSLEATKTASINRDAEEQSLSSLEKEIVARVIQLVHNLVDIHCGGTMPCLRSLVSSSKMYERCAGP